MWHQYIPPRLVTVLLRMEFRGNVAPKRRRLGFANNLSVVCLVRRFGLQDQLLRRGLNYEVWEILPAMLILYVELIHGGLHPQQYVWLPFQQFRHFPFSVRVEAS